MRDHLEVIGGPENGMARQVQLDASPLVDESIPALAGEPVALDLEVGDSVPSEALRNPPTSVLEDDGLGVGGEDQAPFVVGRGADAGAECLDGLPRLGPHHVRLAARHDDVGGSTWKVEDPRQVGHADAALEIANPGFTVVRNEADDEALAMGTTVNRELLRVGTSRWEAREDFERPRHGWNWSTAPVWCHALCWLPGGRG